MLRQIAGRRRAAAEQARHDERRDAQPPAGNPKRHDNAHKLFRNKTGQHGRDNGIVDNPGCERNRKTLSGRLRIATLSGVMTS
jgi:hypothetical protein